jgi:hypothetical protein
MSQYPELVLKLTALKAAMLRTVDFTKPYAPLLAEIKYIENEITRISSLQKNASKELHFGLVMSIVQMPRYLYDDVDWHQHPEVDTLIHETTELARNIIDTENLRPFPRKTPP